MPLAPSRVSRWVGWLRQFCCVSPGSRNNWVWHCLPTQLFKPLVAVALWLRNPSLVNSRQSQIRLQWVVLLRHWFGCLNALLLQLTWAHNNLECSCGWSVTVFWSVYQRKMGHTKNCQNENDAAFRDRRNTYPNWNQDWVRFSSLWGASSRQLREWKIKTNPDGEVVEIVRKFIVGNGVQFSMLTWLNLWTKA